MKHRNEKRSRLPDLRHADRAEAAVPGTRAQATGGDKGSKNTNDYEVSGRDRNLDQGKHNPENLGREGTDNEKTSRGPEKPNREMTTEATADAEQETADRPESASAPVADRRDDKKPRKTTKHGKGSRKPGTELTKRERDAVAAAPLGEARPAKQEQGAETAGDRDDEAAAEADHDKQKATPSAERRGTRPEKETDRAARSRSTGGTPAHRAG